MVGSLPRFVRLVFARIGLLTLSGDRRDAEILALRHQVLVLQRQVARPRFTEADRTILAVLSQALDRRRLSEVFLIVQAGDGVGLASTSRRPPLDPAADSTSRVGHPPRRRSDGWSCG